MNLKRIVYSVFRIGNCHAIRNTEYAKVWLRSARWVAPIGFGFGLGLARVLFETFPLAFGLLGNWLPALGLGLLLAVLLALQSPAWVAWLGRLHARKDHPPHDRTSLAADDVLAHLPLLLPLLAAPLPDVAPLRSFTLLIGGLGGWLALRLAKLVKRAGLSPSWLRVGLPAALFVSALWLYLNTIAPTVGEADTFEFQVNVVRLGISHGSGYPLYMLLAKLFSWLPVGGTSAFRINLSSAVFGALSVVMAYALTRQLAVARGAAALAALALGASIGLWSRAVEAEVYTLNVFLVGVILLLLLRITLPGARIPRSVFRNRPIRNPQSAIRNPQSAICNPIPLLFLTFGLSFANHLTTGLLGPAVLIALLIARPRAPARTWLFSLGLFMLGLALYVYLPLRWPAVNNGELLTLDRFLGFLTGQEAHGAVRPWAFVQDFGRYGVVGRKVLEQFGWVGVGLAAIGLLALARRHWPAAAITVTAWAGYIYFGLSFYVPDPDFSSFLLPAHLVQAVWIAFGINTLISSQFTILNSQFSITNYQLPIVHSALRIVNYTIFALLPLFAIWLNYHRVDKSNDWQAYELGRTILEQPLAEGATILADSEKIASLYYLQVVEGVRPDLDIVVLPNEETYRAELDARVASGQTVYLGRYLPHLAEAYYLHSYGPLTEVSPAPLTSMPLETNASIRFGTQIELYGFALAADAVPAGEDLHVTLVWQALAPPEGNYLVHFRLLDPDGEPAWAWPGDVPVGEMYPTAAWPLDDIIPDFYALPLDHALLPGNYQLQIALFPPFSESGLLVNTTEREWADLAAVTVLSPTNAPTIPHPLRARLGADLWLLGYDLPAATAPGTALDLTLYWLATPLPAPPLRAANGEGAGGRSKSSPAPFAAPDGSGGNLYQVEIFSAGETLSLLDVPAGAYPTGQVFLTRTRLTTPRQGDAMPLRVARAGHMARCGWLAPPTETCALPEVRLEGTAIAPGAINFDNQIVLEDLQILDAEAHPGDTIVVTAQWHGLRAMNEDYTVFVHLLGPDGLVHGQVDAWPVQGTLPTTEWEPGQHVADRFEILLPLDAPPGDYQVEVGWYLLATLDRLPVLNEEGRQVDDKYLESGLMVTAQFGGATRPAPTTKSSRSSLGHSSFPLCLRRWCI